MRCLPHPISGAVYQELDAGLVRVEDKAKGVSGVFRWDGAFIEGDLTQADLHYLRFIGGPTLPPHKDIIWNFLPVTDPETGVQTSLPPSRGGASKDGARVKFGSIREGLGSTEFFLDLTREWSDYAIMIPAGEDYNSNSMQGGVWNAFSVIVEPQDHAGGTNIFVAGVSWGP